MQRVIVSLMLAVAISLLLTTFAKAQTEVSLAAGQAKAAAGDIQGALQIYTDLTRQGPESAEAFAHLGGMQLLKQDYTDAVKSFQRAISLGATDARAFIGMGMAYLHLSQLGPARAAFVEAQSRGNNNPDEIAEIIAWIDAKGGAERR